MVQKYDGRSTTASGLNRGEGAQFDWEKVWEFQLSTWSATSRDFGIYIDKIAAEK